MSRIKFTQFLPTQTMKQIDRTKAINEQHIRISRSMLYSNAFQNLTAVEIKLYMAMRMKFHKEEEKNEEFAFAKSLGVKILKLSSNSEKTIRRGLRGLVQKGFIEQTYISKGGGKNTKLSNRYKFSSNWKQYN